MINYAFDYKRIRYNCKKCKGLCCNINGYLHFTKNQLTNLNIGDLLVDYLSAEGEYYKCKIPKKCWFLGEEGCTLDSFTKPLECKMYPLVPWRLSEKNIVCEFNPCPNFPENSGQYLFNEELEKLIEDYDREIGIEIHPYMKKIKCSKAIDEEEQMHKRRIFNKKLYEDYKSESVSVMRGLLTLFSQITMHPIGFYLNDEEIQILKNIYESLCRKNTYKYNTTNFQNMYIITRNETLKRALLLFYYPINNEIENKLKKEELEVLENIKQKKDSFLSDRNINIFLRFYRSNKTNWIKR